MRYRLLKVAAADLAAQFQEPERIEDSPERGKVDPAMTTIGRLDDMAGRAVLRIRAVPTLDRRGWAEVEFALDSGRHVRIIANGKGENLSFMFWISTASWWRPWTWFRGYWKGLRPSDFAWEP